ncbi:MAG: RNA polymerase sigma factor [Solirubrobacteraceae bacterium]
MRALRLRLRVVLELDYPAVAARLGVSQQVARARVSRALRSLSLVLDASLPLAWLLTGSRVGAEDVVHDAMAAVYRSFDRLDSPTAHLRRTVVNIARSWQRDERRQHERASFLAAQTPAFADPGAGDVLHAVGSLPYRQQVVIIARYWGGWSETEIAEMLGCRPGTVKSLASRAINHLRKEVQP